MHIDFQIILTAGAAFYLLTTVFYFIIGYTAEVAWRSLWLANATLILSCEYAFLLKFSTTPFQHWQDFSLSLSFILTTTCLLWGSLCFLAHRPVSRLLLYLATYSVLAIVIALALSNLWYAESIITWLLSLYCATVCTYLAWLFKTHPLANKIHLLIAITLIAYSTYWLYYPWLKHTAWFSWSLGVGSVLNMLLNALLIALIMSDFQERILATERLAVNRANHDDLTGLYRRSMLPQLFEEAKQNTQQEHSHLALLFLDLNSFKAINDNLGHATGDCVLRHIADILTRITRHNDIQVRHGGDEFVIVLSKLKSGTDDALLPFLERLENMLKMPVTCNGHTIMIGASVGISYYPKNADNLIDLIAIADEDMYKVKNDINNLSYPLKWRGSKTLFQKP